MTKTLDTYDPNWEARHEKIHRQLEELRAKRPNESRQAKLEALTEELHAAFHAQFETAAQYRDWLLPHVRMQAETSRVPYIMPVLSDDCTVEEIRAVYTAATASIERRRSSERRGLPTYTPPEGEPFSTSLAAHETREAFIFEHIGFWNTPTKCGVILEKRQDKVAVCFTHLPGVTGTSPTNEIEDLATFFYARVKSQYTPEQVTFYIHVPSVVARFSPEIFTHVDMAWDAETERFCGPQWNHQQQIPEVLKHAEKLHLLSSPKSNGEKFGSRGTNLKPVEP